MCVAFRLYRPHGLLSVAYALVETQTRSGSFGWDLLSQAYPEQSLTVISSRKPVITEAYNLPNRSNPEDVEEADAWAEWFQNYVAPGDDPSAPASDLQWPVLSREFNSVEVIDDGTNSTKNPRVVAVLVSGSSMKLTIHLPSTNLLS